MKDNLKSLTFLLLVRIDTIQRLENTMIVVELLCRYFDTNVMVREAGLYNNNILASLLKKRSSMSLWKIWTLYCTKQGISMKCLYM